MPDIQDLRKKNRTKKYNNFTFPAEYDSHNTPTVITDKKIREFVKENILEKLENKRDIFYFLCIILTGISGICLFKYNKYKTIGDISNSFIYLVISLVLFYLFIKLIPAILKCKKEIKLMNNNKFLIKKLTILDLKTKKDINNNLSFLNNGSSALGNTKYKVVTDGGIFPMKKKRYLNNYVISESYYFIFGVSKSEPPFIIDSFQNDFDLIDSL